MLEKPVSKNYCATVVCIEKVVDLPNCDSVVAAIIFGNSVIVGKDTKIGDIGLFFPVETQLSKEFLHNNNLYRQSDLNFDKTKKGYFEENGRIKTMKFRGQKSEGLFMPIGCLDYILGEGDPDPKIGEDFDKIKGHLICKKYMIKIINDKAIKTKADKKAVKKFDRLVENQFRLHIDTEQLRRNVHKINPEDYISITNKLHGTSWVVGKVLTKKPLSKIKTFLKKLIPEIDDTIYYVIYSSRSVVKNKYINTETKNNLGYYNFDLWTEIAKELEPYIDKGITLYGEAVGQLPTGGWIQKGYHYGTRPTHYDIYVYRITYTNPDGKLIELSWPQIKEYCKKYDLKHVPEFYYGKAKNYCPSIPIEQHWHENFLNKLEKDFMLGRMCPMNNDEVPEEGIVVRIDGLYECSPYKLKNFRFLKKETDDLDKGVVDLETEQSVNTEGSVIEGE